MTWYNSDIIPSGIHFGQTQTPISYGLAPPPDLTGVPPEQIRVEMCNPMGRRPVPLKILEVAPPRFLDDLREKYQWAKVVERSDVADYGEQIPEIRKTLDAYRYHAIIVPYRGAVKPWVQLSVLAQHTDKVINVPFTRASHRDNDERLRLYLWQGLAAFSEEAELRLAVVDTGRGGHGSVTMADLLRECHKDDARRRWHVHFHLIHKKGEYPPLSRKLPAFSGDNFHVNPFPWPVSDLIMEDWDTSIGLKAVWDDGMRAVVEEASTDGEVIIKEKDNLVVVHSPVIHHYMDSQLGAAVSDAVVMHPEMPHFGGDVWEKYLADPPGGL